MYKEDFYHLKTEPFNTHPNPDILFNSETHKEAWYYLLFGIETQEPFLVLTGEYGMGKTLLCLRLIQAIKKQEKFPVEYIATPNEGYGGILRRIAGSLGISAPPEREALLQDMIYDHFRADTEKNRFFLIIDDAHEMDTALLTKLKHLSSFNHEGFFPFVMFFVAHPSFLQGLKTPALSSLSQRIKRRFHLARFSFEDTKNYISFRLLKSGGTGIPVLPDETLQKIFEFSGGIPRLINNICDTCLLIGASRGLITIPPDIVDEAKKVVEGSLVGTEEEDQVDLASGNDDVPFMTISEDLPRKNSAQQDSPTRIEMDLKNEPAQKAPLPHPKTMGKKMKKAVIMAVLAIFLMILGGLLYQYFVYDNPIFASFSTADAPAEMPAPVYRPVAKPVDAPIAQKQEQIPIAPVKPEQASPEIPTLREEMTGQPSGERAVPADRTEAVSSTQAAISQQQIRQVDVLPPTKPENATSGFGKPDALYPYSLRASSYQQPDRAFQEIAEIRQLGLTPYLVKVNLGDMGVWWRIHIGFFSAEEEAKAVQASYKLPRTTIQKTDYACLIGEYSNETDIMNMFEKLKKSGYFPYVIQKGRDRNGLYIGAFERKAEAETERQDLIKNGFSCQLVKR